MPFQDDTGMNLDVERGPLASVFATLADQLERLIALNVFWALQLLPALAALAWPELPGSLRLLLVVYTMVAFAPATIVLYKLTYLAALGEHLHPQLTGDTLRERGLSGARALIPLLGLIGMLLWGAQADSFAVSALCQLGLFLLLLCANYWGALIVDRDLKYPLDTLRASARLVWRYPAQTLLLSGAALLAFIIGAVSIGGLFLIVPVLIALLQIQMYRQLTGKKRHGTTASRSFK